MEGRDQLFPPVRFFLSVNFSEAQKVSLYLSDQASDHQYFLLLLKYLINLGII